MSYKSIFNVVGVVALLAVALTGCVDDNGGNPGGGPGVTPSVTKGTFVDSRDGKTYKKVTIGGKTWMAENLNYAAEGSKCYEDNPSNCAKYGRLYNWATALPACPAGWRLPTDDEWAALVDYAGGEETAGKKLKSASGWVYYSDADKGTDNYGFSALPDGYGTSGGRFSDAGTSGTWWSATEYGATYAWTLAMVSGFDRVYRTYRNTTFLYSVRCVED